MKYLPMIAATGFALVTMTFSGCDTPAGQGAGIGAATGAVFGALATGDIRGAAAGAAVGAVTGAAVGQIAQDERCAEYEGVYGAHYRYGHPSSHYGYVRSPYPPNALVDVRGIPRGARVIDPVSDRIFLNP